MALVNTRADGNRHLEPWRRACDRFSDGLSDEQVKLFKDTSVDKLHLEDWFYSADLAQKVYSNHSKYVKFHQKIQPLVEVLEDYGKALDTLAQTAALYLCPIWGSSKSWERGQHRSLQITNILAVRVLIQVSCCTSSAGDVA